MNKQRVRYQYVEWSSKGNLVEEAEMPAFIADLNHFGFSFGFSKELDPFNAGERAKNLPAAYRQYLKAKAVTAQVVRIEAGLLGDVMVIDKGSEDGLLRDMILFRGERDIRSIAQAKVIALSAHESKLERHGLYYPEKTHARLGWLWTTGEYGNPVTN